MSRFDAPRSTRILIWTGATLAWGAALTAVAFEASGGEAASAPDPAVAVVAPVKAVLPTPPARGLVILRYTPSESPPAEVQTVYVRRTVAAPAAPSAPAAAPPAPRSSGS